MFITMDNEIRRLKKIAGLLKENQGLENDRLQDMVDDIVNKSNGDKQQEYDFTIDLIKDLDGSTILDLADFARGANYHEIADACFDYLKKITHG